jgi:PAS domain S-box-containing protein
VVFVNDAACRHFGHSREQLLGMSPADWDPNFTLATLRTLWAGRTGPADHLRDDAPHRGRTAGAGRECARAWTDVDGEDFPVGFVRDLSVRRRQKKPCA